MRPSHCTSETEKSRSRPLARAQRAKGVGQQSGTPRAGERSLGVAQEKGDSDAVRDRDPHPSAPFSRVGSKALKALLDRLERSGDEAQKRGLTDEKLADLLKGESSMGRHRYQRSDWRLPKIRLRSQESPLKSPDTGRSARIVAVLLHKSRL